MTYVVCGIVGRPGNEEEVENKTIKRMELKRTLGSPAPDGISNRKKHYVDGGSDGN